MIMFLERLVGIILSSAFACYFGIYSVTGGICQKPPETPSDFTPVVRFAVCSDVHINGEEGQVNAERFENLFKDSYAYASSQNYKALDAVLVVGDMTNSGLDIEYEMLNKIVDENTTDGTQVLFCMGNHEFIAYRNSDVTIGYEKYKEFISEDVDTHTVIGGYHFIGVSYANDSKTFDGKTAWLEAEIEKAIADTPDKPIFVFQHPHPTMTVFGSINWSCLEIKTTLMKYPQVIDFSGHSHYASNDPRSINQTSFTSIGTGSLKALMGDIDYISGSQDAPEESACFWIVEADKDGNVVLKLYDIVSRRFYDNVEYYIPNVTQSKKKYYSWNNLKSLDTAPVFPKNAAVTASNDENGDTVLSFTNAEGYFAPESYRITVKSGTKEVWSGAVISSYVRADLTQTRVNVGKLASGEYTVKIIPCSPYAKAGKPLTTTVTVK